MTVAAFHDQPMRVSAANLARLGACMFGIANSFYLTLSTAPAHLSTLGGDAAAGAATTVSTFATVLSLFFAPRLVSVAGRRTVFAFAAMALGFPCVAVFGNSLAIAELACAIRGAGLGLAFVSAGGLAAALAPPSRRGEVLGIYGLAFGLPAIFAVPAGLWLFARQGGVSLALVATMCALLPLLGLGVFPGLEKRSRYSPSWDLPWRSLGWPLLAQTGGAAAVGMMITSFATAVGSTVAAAVALAMFLHGLASSLTRWWGGRIGDRHGQRLVIAAGSGLSMVATLLLASGDSPAMLIAGATVLGAAFGLQRTGTLILMLARTSPPESDAVNAAWNIAYDAGLGLGALAYAGLAPALGHSLAIVAIAAAFATTTVASFLCLEKMTIEFRFDRGRDEENDLSDRTPRPTSTTDGTK